MSISEQTLKKIKKDKIEQTPKWRFNILNFLKWTFITTTVIITALVFAIIIEYYSHLDLDLYSRNNPNVFGYIIGNVPGILIVILILLGIFAFFEFRSTSKGYKYDRTLILGAVSGLVILVGAIFVGTGISNVLQKSTPVYTLVTPNADNYWLQPEYGLLSGRIITTYSNNAFELLDDHGGIWQVVYDNKSSVGFHLGTKIRASGINLGNNKFIAKEIREVRTQYKLFIFK